MLSNKTVLLTGGTGSFGNAFIERFIDTDIKKIIIFSRDEDKQDLMRNEYKNSKLKFVLGNVRDYDLVHDAMRGVDVVFHAAALKQVPSCDFAPLEAVKTNVFGTDNIIRAAIDHNVEDVICLSTGKAVYPINAMGLSKALMEKTIVNRARQINEEEDTHTTLKYIRYSNVFATRGSAVNIFTKQIIDGKPITLTHPEMKRSIMTVDEAVELALFAMQNGENGDLFVYKARRTTLQNLAECLFEVYDAKCREIEVIGARHGEKMEETILSQDELVRAIDLDSFVRVPMDKRGLNYMAKENIEKNKRNMKKVGEEQTRLEMRVPSLKLDDVRKMIDKNWVKECDLEEIETPDVD
jgi:UDP-glucose 4-epimerase